MDELYNDSYMDRSLTGFQLWLTQVRHYRPKTVYKTVCHLRRVLAQVTPLNKENFDTLIFRLYSESKSASYIEDHIVSVRLYTTYLRDNTQPYDEQLLKYPLPKKEDVYKGILTDEEIELIINYPRRNNEYIKIHTMWNLFFSILAYTGMRPGELAKTTPSHFDWGRRVIIIEGFESKTSKTRMIPIPSFLEQRIKDWIGKKKPNELLFTRNSGKPIRDTTWWEQFDKRIRFYNLKRKGITPYSLRHSFCTRLLEEDVNLFKIMKNMGHSNPKTTMTYSHLTTKDLHETANQLPIARSKLDPSETLKAIKDFIHSLKLDSRFDLTIIEKATSVNIDVSFNTNK